MLLINEPHDLQAEDFFDYKQKGDAIVELLKSGVFNKNKMFALYGDWGSGKTSLMKYISTQLDQSQYKTFFFEAWKHEKDEDMNTSLLEMITESLGVNLSTKEFLETIASGIKAFGKGLSYESKLLGLKFDLGKIISGTEEELKVLRDEVSFYTKIKIFSEKYRKIESSVLDNERKEKLTRSLHIRFELHFSPHKVSLAA